MDIYVNVIEHWKFKHINEISRVLLNFANSFTAINDTMRNETTREKPLRRASVCTQNNAIWAHKSDCSSVLSERKKLVDSGNFKSLCW